MNAAQGQPKERKQHRGLRKRLHLDHGTMDTLKTVTGVSALGHGMRGLGLGSEKACHVQVSFVLLATAC